MRNKCASAAARSSPHTGADWVTAERESAPGGRRRHPQYVTAWCDGGYTTNLALEDVTEAGPGVVREYGGELHVGDNVLSVRGTSRTLTKTGAATASLEFTLPRSAP